VPHSVVPGVAPAEDARINGNRKRAGDVERGSLRMRRLRPLEFKSEFPGTL